MIIEKLSNEDYHKHPALSSSKLKLMDKSIEHYVKYIPEQKDAFDKGSALHDLILLPEVFKAKYVEQRADIDVRKGKKWDDFVKEHEGKTILRRGVFEELNRMRDSVYRHPRAKVIFSEGEAEYSYFTKKTFSGVELELKCRPDFVSKGEIIDIKTCRDSTKDGFRQEIKRWKYHKAAAFYIDVVSAVTKIERDAFIFVAIENEHPFRTRIYNLDQESIDLGRKKYKENIANYVKYLKDNNFMYTEHSEIESIGLPNYEFYEETM